MRLKNKNWKDDVLLSKQDLYVKDNLEDPKLDEFLSRDNLVLEIGSGKGDFVINMSKRFPEYNFLAVEIQSMALAYALKKMEEKIDNILFVNVDGTKFVEGLVDKKIKYIFLNFSDPWPKKKQNKRRLTYPKVLNQYLRILEVGGELIFKTDNDVLFEDSLEYLKETEFEVISVDRDYQHSDFDEETEYEHKFRSIGKNINRVVVRRSK